jgi:hypothetical protein
MRCFQAQRDLLSVVCSLTRQGNYESFSEGSIVDFVITERALETTYQAG